MKRKIIRVLMETLIGSVVLFGVTVIFIGAALRSPAELLTAFGLSWATVLLVELLVGLHRMNHDPDSGWIEEV